MTTTGTISSMGQPQHEAAARPAPRASVWPLAPLQAGLLYHAVSSEDGLDVYSMQSTYAFAAGIDLEALHRACASLLARHDSLRAGFSTALMDRPVQFIPHTVATPWRVVDLSDRTPEAAAAALAAVQVAERQRRFDMDAPPLIRFVAVDLGADGVRLVVTNHHIVIDGWSDALLVVELLRHVAAQGCDETLAPAPSFGRYLALLQHRDADEDARAWRRALSGLEAGTLLAETAPGVQAVLPEVVETGLGQDLTRSVTALARRCAVSVNTVYSTVWGLTLRDLVGRDDVVFGTTVSGRPADLDGVEDMVGLFLNTVPQRMRVAPAESVAALLTRVQSEQAQLVEHHHVGLGALQQQTGIGDLFDTLYVMRNTPTDDASFDELARTVGLLDIDSGDATHYPATFIVHPEASTRLILSYRADVLTEADAHRILAGAVRLLEQMTASPETAVAALSPRDDEAEAALVASWSGQEHPIAPESLVEWLMAAAQAEPERIALVDGAEQLTFAHLWSRVRACAAFLCEAGVAPGDLVTIELPRGAGVVVAIFAAFAVRAAYVPVDVSAPASRQDAIREATHPACRITPDWFASMTGRFGGEHRWVPVSGYRHEDLAYVMFTSGSAGAPKGVAIEHTGLVNMLANHRRRIFAPAGATPQRPWRVAHAVSFAFDMSWEELLWLLDGHEVHLLDDEMRRDPGSMSDYLARARIDVVNVTPSVAGALLADGLLLEKRAPRLVLLGGEAVTADVWEALRDAPATDGYNLYGPTEYTINTLGGGTQESATPIVGRAIDNTRVRVLDSGLRPVPDGTPGELYVTGAGLARGYHGAPALTAERFVADPYAPPGSRMYRTGDIVSRRLDGVFDFHGRSDAQVKIRGHRVEPGEVQAVLAGDPRVARCAVIAVPMPPGGPALVAYLVPAGIGRPERVADADEAVQRLDLPEADIDAIRDRLRERLPEVMVPAAWVAVDHLPFTVHSKLDVSALPAPDVRARRGRGPRGPLENAVCEVFAEVLAVDEVGVEDNFFALGGHSLTAMRAVGLLGKRLARRVGVAALMAAPTPAALVGQLDAGGDPTDVVLALGGQPGRQTAPVFCLHPMLGLGWTFSSLAARLAERRPEAPAVYALQSPALADPDFSPANMRSYARLLLARAVGTDPSVQSHGVHLVGWSFGAHLAHVLASLAESGGVAVRSLTLLDPGPTVGSAGDEHRDAAGDASAGGVQEALGFLLAASLRDIPEWMTPPYDADEALEFLAEGTGAFSALDADDLAAFARVGTLGRRLLDGVTYAAVSAPTTLVVATGGDQTHDPEAAVQSWRRECRTPLRVTSIDVPHDLMTSPYASERVAPLIGA